MRPDPLPGGRMTAPHRVGEMVHRRPRRPNPRALEALAWFEACGWNGAPRVVSVEPDGTQRLTYLPGRVPWQQPVPPWANTDEALVQVAELVRAFHDLTAGHTLAGDAEVLCHNDLAPSNTVYGESAHPYAFIDWDLAAPGRRIDDVAHVCWMWLDLGPGVADIDATAGRIRRILTAYGDFAAADVVPAILGWQDRCALGIEAEARAGDPVMQQLVADGTVHAIRAAAAWTRVHASQLEAPS